MTGRIGNSMETYTGREVWPLDLRPEDVSLDDIAHSLSMQCRFAGHTLFHYSVAQHSLLVAELVSPEYRLCAMLHDAAEAYLVDLPSPVKRLPEFEAAYRQAEDRALHSAILPHCGVSQEEWAAAYDYVHHADQVALSTEMRDVMRCPVPDWRHHGPTPDDRKIEQTSIADVHFAYRGFLRLLLL